MKHLKRRANSCTRLDALRFERRQRNWFIQTDFETAELRRRIWGRKWLALSVPNSWSSESTSRTTGRLVKSLFEGRIRAVNPTDEASVGFPAVEFSTERLKTEDWVVGMDT